MADEHRPRSRFDRDDSDRPPRSRFDRDRRSRSPSSREPEPRRARSPVGRGTSDSPASMSAEKKSKLTGAAAAAAAAAARINAQIQAKKGIQHVDVPPIRSAISPQAVKSPNLNPGKAVSGDIIQQDGDFIQDIEINDLRNRYTLTKGAVQKRVKEETGADVTTRGEYYPDKALATAASPPLYLRVTSTSKDGLEAAVKMIEDMMQQDLPNLVDERRFRRREPENFERDEFGRRKWPEEKLPVDLEPISGFNLRAQVVGRGGDNVKYIQQETGCKVQIKGRGSGFMESSTGQESEDPMYLHIAGPRPEGVEKAKALCEELLRKVRDDYQVFKESAPQGRFGGGDRFSNGRSGGYDGRSGGYEGRPGGYGDRERSQSYGHGGYGGQNDLQSPPPAGDANAQGSDYNPWAAYYTQPGQAAGADPYAAYGGYESYVQWYQYYYAQHTGMQQSPAPGTTAAPPPPASEPGPPGGAPPPPPPSGSPPGGYNAVPPPPGM
ncbi:hypothetical protein K458DRAFT_491984 [Lentithecium fluviatile CBS 122367]|uniref:K Homology domain-containing protein n=1 Tax=Lentithecium fluviatile CBS 122367 TaxID=1168545 RepID=A0A6G1IH24_9PLEO|nr:hypothetical protein K458DRAFT_491984 [Lentithecium fluviatile CBS 122367]